MTFDWIKQRKQLSGNSTAEQLVDVEPHIYIIIIVDSMTLVFNTDASLPYNHDLFESLIVKKRIKKLTTRSPLTSVSSHIMQRLQPCAARITRSPSWKASRTDSTQTFRDFSHTLLPGQRLATSLLPPL
ncbi:hypothetical protein CSKR_105904 [Clonorchis sinensis]|uniref:Uncharacterized protein n=1 Tax=Clonorchis sinensis TaxID=79923 RepID=A0A3R7FSX2_CLOSI|nr:hypothetical protein CSKR_105904 [Clonorchis sinensis]